MVKAKSTQNQSPVRKTIVLQLVLIAMAVILRAFFWASKSSISLLPLLAAVLIAGNLANLLFLASQPVFAGIPRRWNLPVRLGALVIFGVSAGILTQMLAFWMYAPPGSHFPWNGTQIRVSVFLIVVVNVVLYVSVYAYTEMKNRLDARNRELQGQVQLGRVKEQMIEAELEQAHEIQVHLLPRETPQLEGFQIACAWQPARSVSGDYFDVLPLGPGQMGLCIADVSGKGITAALLMANLQASVKAFALESTTPAALCAKLNSVLCGTVAPGKFVTLFYAVIDTQQRRLQYENAGHCLPLIVRANGSIEMPASYSGVLGLFSHWTYADHELQLATGDCVLLVTDGVLEAANSDEEEFGYQRLIEVVQLHRSLGAHGLRQKILEEVTAFCNGQFQDDASLILLTVD
jgi:sigma-B regulation protein RsbU (phosphoserine phosphatase)